MTSLLERVPMDRIQVEARQIQFTRTVLTLIAGFFFLIGWVAAVVWGAIAWSAAAVKVGWLEARESRASSGGG